MFGKPIRTYERKKGVFQRPANIATTIVREDIPPDIEQQPPEFKFFNRNNVSLEYDPFETTFDRLAKDIIPHPIPIDQETASLYSDSSSSSNDSPKKDPLSNPDDLFYHMGPFHMSPEPVPISKKPQKRGNKRARLNPQNKDDIETITITNCKYPSLASGLSFNDENSEPNIVSKKKDEGKKKGLRKKILSTKRRPENFDKKVSTIRTDHPKGKKRKSPENPQLVKKCRVNLKRLSTPIDDSPSSINQNSEEGEKHLESKGDDEPCKFAKSIPLEKTADPTDFVNPSIVVETPRIDEKKVTLRSFKNPILTLSRLMIPNKRIFMQSFSSSTPIGTRDTKRKSLIRLSPIRSESHETFEDAEKIKNSGPDAEDPRLESSGVPDSSALKNSTSEPNVDQSMKRAPDILSVSPDPDPSSLMFDDTEIIEEKSASPVPKNSITEKPDHQQGSNRESSDAESDLHLIYTDDNEIEPTKLISDNHETIELSATQTMSTSNVDPNVNMRSEKDPFMGCTQEQADEEENMSNKSPNTDEEWSTVSSSTEISNFIEQLSSHESSSSEGITEFAKANEISNGLIEYVNSYAEASSVVNDEGKNLEKTKIKDKSDRLLQPVVKLTESINSYAEASSKVNDTDKNLEKAKIKSKSDRLLQPVVKLTRLDFSLIEKLKTMANERRRLIETLEEVSHVSSDAHNSMNFPADQSTDLEESRPHEYRSETEDSQGEMVSEITEKSVHDSRDSELSIQNSTITSNVYSESAQLLETPERSLEDSKIAEKSESQTESTETSKMEISQNLHDRLCSVRPVVLLTRLNDPFRITKRRNRYRKWGYDLSAIKESNFVEETISIIKTKEKTSRSNDKIDDIAEEVPDESAKLRDDKSPVLDIVEPIINASLDKGSKLSLQSSQVSTPVPSSQTSTISVSASSLNGANLFNESARENKVVFLKPGKSWARSLSILNQVHSQMDVDSLAVGKGRKWRESVRSLMDMQQQGLVQSCLQKNKVDKKSQSLTGLRHSTVWALNSSQSDPSRFLGIPSPGRFIRRISIRVVPDSKKFDNVQDTPFLEAYGIRSSENKQTLEERRTLTDVRKTLEVIPESLSNLKSRNVVLSQCGQKSSSPFEETYPETYLEKCRKIGEGVYGEVFLYENGAERNVIKIIPIEGDLKINSERQKKFDEILSEIVIAKELHNLRYNDKSKTSSFIEVKNIKCVKGKYPKKLIDLWRTFDEEKRSENDCPSIFDENQLYIVLELGHGGEDLEAFIFQNAAEAHALFIQTALALAVAEESLEFEHRDLHWGNLLISRTDESQIDYKLNDKPITVASKGVKVSVIDFTLSRMSYQGCSIFNDLSMDDDLFVAQGEYQFDIYRLMRNKLENNWQSFEPFTNILWLHYILDKMITAVRYRRTNTKIHKTSIDKLQQLLDKILEYSSAIDFTTNCDNVTRLQTRRTSVTTVTSSSSSLSSK